MIAQAFPGGRREDRSPPRASTPSVESSASATTSRSRARNASSPSWVKMSAIGLPALHDHRVDVGEAEVEPAGHHAADRRLAGARRADQHESGASRAGRARGSRRPSVKDAKPRPDRGSAEIAFAQRSSAGRSTRRLPRWPGRCAGSRRANRRRTSPAPRRPGPARPRPRRRPLRGARRRRPTAGEWPWLPPRRHVHGAQCSRHRRDRLIATCTRTGSPLVMPPSSPRPGSTTA